MSLKSFLTLYAGTAKRVVGTMIFGITSAEGRQKVNELYNWYSKPKFNPAAFPKDPYKLPKTDIFELINSESEMNYEGVYQCGFGHLNEFELKVVALLAKNSKAKKIFEIGTFEGRTTLNLALNSEPEAQIFTLDLPQSLVGKTKFALEPDEVKYVIAEQGKRFQSGLMAYKITQLAGDSADFDFTPYQNDIDFVLIDGAHARDYVLNDSEKALEIIKNGGIIVWANYTNWLGVRTVLNELWESKGIYENIKHIGGTSLAVLTVEK